MNNVIDKYKEYKNKKFAPMRALTKTEEDTYFDRFLEGKDKYCGKPVIHNITYKEHLSDSDEFMNIFSDTCEESGKIAKLTAPCGSGKTYAMLVALAQRFKGRKTIVLVTPNSIQSEQNASYAFVNAYDAMQHVIAVTGSSKNDLRPDGNVYSIVYDSAFSRFEELTEEQLKDIIFIIDEAHQLESARSYRANTIEKIRMIANDVQAAGGTVVYMTGTPHKIDGYKSDVVINCRRTDENGNPLLEINVGLIEVRQKKCNRTMREFIIAELLKLIANGYKPMIRVESKKDIEIIKNTLVRLGYKIRTLTADDKKFTIIDDPDKCDVMGHPLPKRKYESKFYQAILEEGVLLDADCYLCTSVLEVGTSLKGIKKEDGTVCQDEKLVPVYACLDDGDCDLDNMRQFLARPRFALEKAILLMNHMEDKHPEIPVTFNEVLRNTAIMAMLARRAANNTKFKNRLNMPTLDNKREDRDIYYDENGLAQLDYERIYADARVAYNKELYRKPSYMQAALEEEFGVKVETTIITTVPKCKKPDPMPVPDEVKELVAKLTTNEKEFSEFQKKNNTDLIKEINHYKEGRQALEYLRRLTSTSTFLPAEAGMIACALVEDPRLTVAIGVKDDMRIVRPLIEVANDVIRAMSHWSAGKGMPQLFVEYWMARENGEDASSSFIKDIEEQKMFLRAIETENGYEKMKAVFDLWQALKGSMSWKEVCEYVINSSLSLIPSMIRAAFYIHFNALDYRLDPKGFTEAVQQNCLRSGAEYFMLRYFEQGFSYVDEAYKDETDEEVRKQHTHKHFVGGFAGKKVTKYDCQQIGKILPLLMKAMCPAAREFARFSGSDIRTALKTIYCCTREKNEDGTLTEDVLKIRGLRQDIRSAFTALKRDKDEVFDDADMLLCDNEVPTDIKEKSIETLEDDLVSVGYTSKQADAMADAVRGGMATRLPGIAMDIEAETPYTSGCLKVIATGVDLAPAHSVLTLSQASSILANSVTDEELMNNIKEALGLCKKTPVDEMNDYFKLNGDVTINFPAEAFPKHLNEYAEDIQPVQKSLFTMAIKEHMFYWGRKWHVSPDDVDGVDQAVADFWRAGKAYSAWIEKNFT